MVRKTMMALQMAIRVKTGESPLPLPPLPVQAKAKAASGRLSHPAKMRKLRRP